jgi:hypothetical protein
MISEELEFRISQYADGMLPAAEAAELETMLAAIAKLAAARRVSQARFRPEARNVGHPRHQVGSIGRAHFQRVADEDRNNDLRFPPGGFGPSRLLLPSSIAFGTVALWPRGKQGEVATTTPNQPEAVALIEVGGPQVASKPAVEEISVEPSALADAENFRISEDIVYRPSRVVIASGDPDRQDSGRLPY